MLLTGDKDVVDSIDLFPVPDVTEGEIEAARQFLLQGAQNGALYVGALSFYGATLGTFQKFPNYNYYIEPAFVPTTEYNGSLSMLTSDPSAPGSQAALQAIRQVLSQSSTNRGGDELTVTPLQTQQVFVESVQGINELLYCGYKQARCNSTSEINEFTNAWDFSGTDFDQGTYSMRFWYNATGRFPGTGNAPTMIVRVQAAANAATNAFLRNAVGEDAIARLVGLMQMPKPATSLSLDIASLVGTLFYTWLLQTNWYFN